MLVEDGCPFQEKHSDESSLTFRNSVFDCHFGETGCLRSKSNAGRGRPFKGLTILCTQKSFLSTSLVPWLFRGKSQSEVMLIGPRTRRNNHCAGAGQRAKGRWLHPPNRLLKMCAMGGPGVWTQATVVTKRSLFRKRCCSLVEH